MIRFSLAAILAFLALGLVACGGGGDGEQTATPEATGQPASPAAGTPADGFAITGNLFESEKNGYQARFPEGWNPRPNFVTAPGLAVDAFFDPNEIEGVQANIAVSCEEFAEGTTLQDYFDGKMDVVRRVGKVEPEISSRSVGGQEAKVAHYRREQAEAPFEKTEVYFLTDRCALTISLTVPLDHGAEYQGPFDEFLDSFQLLS